MSCLAHAYQELWDRSRTRSLVHVDLSRNEAIANETLEPFANLHALKFLNLGMCAGFKGSLEPLRRLFQLQCLHLYGCVALEGSLEPLSGLQKLTYVDLEACFGLTAGLELLAPLRELERLNVCDTQLDATAFIAERQRVLQLPQNAVMEEDWALVVGGCRDGRRGNEVTPLWQAADDGLAATAQLLLLGGGGGPGGVELTQQGRMTAPRLSSRRQHGADMNKLSSDMQAPINIAADTGHVAVVQVLLVTGGDTAIKDKWGDDPLAHALAKDHSEVAAPLMQ